MVYIFRLVHTYKRLPKIKRFPRLHLCTLFYNFKCLNSSYKVQRLLLVLILRNDGNNSNKYTSLYINTKSVHVDVWQIVDKQREMNTLWFLSREMVALRIIHVAMCNNWNDWVPDAILSSHRSYITILYFPFHSEEIYYLEDDIRKSSNVRTPLQSSSCLFS